MFGVLRKWNLSSHYGKTEIIEFLVESQVRPYLEKRANRSGQELGKAMVTR
jgi:hypothetical protein